MKKLIIVISLLLLIPTVSFASTLSDSQIQSIILLLEAFNVDTSIIDKVKINLTGEENTKTIEKSVGTFVDSVYNPVITPVVDPVVTPKEIETSLSLTKHIDSIYEFYKFTAVGENFILQDMVFDNYPNSIDYFLYDSKNFPNIREVGGSWSCGYIKEFPERVPSECSGNYDFISPKTGWGTNITVIKDGYMLFGKTNEFKIISATFVGETTGKIIKLP